MVQCLLVYEDRGKIHGLVLVKSDTITRVCVRIGNTRDLEKWIGFKR